MVDNKKSISVITCHLPYLISGGRQFWFGTLVGSQSSLEGRRVALVPVSHVTRVRIHRQLTRRKRRLTQAVLNQPPRVDPSNPAGRVWTAAAAHLGPTLRPALQALEEVLCGTHRGRSLAQNSQLFCEWLLSHPSLSQLQFKWVGSRSTHTQL